MKIFTTKTFSEKNYNTICQIRYTVIQLHAFRFNLVKNYVKMGFNINYQPLNKVTRYINT